MTLPRRLLVLSAIVAAAAVFVVPYALDQRVTGSCIASTVLARAAESKPEVPAALGVRAEGRLVTYPGADVTVSAERGGRIARLLVAENQSVARGDLIAELDQSEEKAALAEARARVQEAEADVRLLSLERERSEKLVAATVASKQALDKAERDLDAARARRATAEATARRLDAVLAKERIVAPIGGVVVAREVEAGETIDAGTPIVRIANLARTRIEAEVDEYDASRMASGAVAQVTAEGYDGAVWHGTVEEIPDVLVARRLAPQDPGRPSDTRVLLVKVRLEGATPLRLGQRVEVEIASGAAGGARS